MEDILNFVENGRRPPIIVKMEDNLNFKKSEDNLNSKVNGKWHNFLNIFGQNGMPTSKLREKEDDLNFNIN